MIQKSIASLMVLITLFVVYVFTISPAYAGTLIGGGENCNCEQLSAQGTTEECRKYCKGDYNLNDIVQVGVNATNILLGLSGSVALLFFIYGGVTFLISGGSAEKVTKGKTIITNAVIGLIIIFASFMIIQFSMEALGYNRIDGWYQSL